MFSINWEKITYANVTDTIRTIVPIVGVCIAYTSYKKYIKNKLLEKQLEQVLKIIEKIKQCKLTFYFYLSEEQIKPQDIRKQIPKALEYIEFVDENNIKTKVFQQETNLFEIALLSRNYKNVIFQDLKLTDAANQRFKELSQFCYDPLVPKSIAQKLNNFLLSDEIFLVGKMKAPVTSANYVIIGSQEIDDIQTASDISYFSKEENKTSFTSWRNFIVSTQELSKSIKAWMENNGIKEINL